MPSFDPPIPIGSFEIRGDSNMADSPMTDISTDAETDERNKGYKRGQLMVPASDSSDRSKETKNQKTLRRLAQNREAARKRRLRKKGAGLENLGNTCFLNSVLQCLTYTEPLAAYLQSGKHQTSYDHPCPVSCDF